jgi:hypothetical protein
MRSLMPAMTELEKLNRDALHKILDEIQNLLSELETQFDHDEKQKAENDE